MARSRRIRPRFWVFLAALTGLGLWYSELRHSPGSAPNAVSHSKAPPSYRSSSWLVLPRSLPVALSGMAGTSVGNQGFFAGGMGVTSVDTVYRVTSAGYSLLTRLPTALHDAGAAVLGQTLYVIGGGQSVSLPTVYAISLQNPGQVTTMPPLPVPLSDLGAVSYDGAVFLVGGHGSGAPSRAVLRYRPGQGVSPFALLPVGVRYAAVALSGSRLWVAGGMTSTGPTPDVEVVNLATGRVLRLPPLPYPVEYAEAAVIQNRLWVVGGKTPAGWTRRVVIYDPSHKIWQSGPPLPAPAGDGALLNLSSGPVVVGGRNAHGALASIWELHVSS